MTIAQSVPSADLSEPAIDRWLSLKRFAPYRSAAGQSVVQALRLYDWNARLTAACLRDIGHLEVLIRNEYDRAISLGHPGWSDSRNALWRAEIGLQRSRDRQAASNRVSRRSLELASRKAPHLSHGHTIANLSFGFWAALTQAEREPTVWTPFISRLYPGLKRGRVHDSMARLNVFRNRLAHWEPVFSQTTGVGQQLERVEILFAALNRDVGRWVGEQSAVPELIRLAPADVISVRCTSYLGESLRLKC